MLFWLDAMLFDCKLLLLWCWIEFSLLPCKLLLTITRDAPSKRSFKLSPTNRKFGKRIQHVFTVHEPDIPWHLHSWRISDCTCCKEIEIRKKIINLIFFILTLYFVFSILWCYYRYNHINKWACSKNAIQLFALNILFMLDDCITFSCIKNMMSLLQIFCYHNISFLLCNICFIYLCLAKT